MKLRNLGAVSWRMLRAANIGSEAELRALGSVAAYVAVKRVGSPSLNLLWALEGALSGRDWRQISREERLLLMMQLDDLERSPVNQVVTKTST